MSESILNQTKNGFTCIGTVYEKKLERTEVTIEAGPKDDKKPVKTELISGPIAVRIPSGIVNFYLYVTKTGYNGKDNFQWAMAEAALDSWNPHVNGDGEKPTKVEIRGELNPRDYYDEKSAETRFGLGFRIVSANTRVSEDAPEGMTVKVDAFVHSMKNETKDDKETGRLLVNLLGVDFKSRCYPIACIVEEDGAETITDGEDDFEAFEAGQTRTGIELDYRIVSDAPVAEPTKKKVFGKSSGVEVTDRTRTKVELVIYSADCSPVEEPDPDTLVDDEGNEIEDKSGYINPAVMKKAIKIRSQMLEELKANPPEKKTKGSSDFKSQKANVEKKSKAVRKSKPPFNMEDDDDDF